MAIRFISGTYKSLPENRQFDVRRLLHIAFDHGYLFEVAEIETAWEKVNGGNWLPLTNALDDQEIWTLLKECLPAAI